MGSDKEDKSKGSDSKKRKSQEDKSDDDDKSIAAVETSATSSGSSGATSTSSSSATAAAPSFKFPKIVSATTTAQKNDGSSSVNENDEDLVGDDMSKISDFDSWYYLDSSGNRQGPFTFSMMSMWWASGSFQADLKVRKVGEKKFVPITAKEEFIDPAVTGLPNPYGIAPSGNAGYGYDYGTSASGSGDNVEVEEEYDVALLDPMLALHQQKPVQAGFFNKRTGQFQTVSAEEHWATKRIPDDRAGRQLSHYLDVERYQETMRAAKDKEDVKTKRKRIK